ncbi:unnamed protein product [Pleuronectes platessa]|uniref:Uncharacterized protein n=1 Tax=Pleuronectes platessa TaxID=8262 RepID=A0A9N7TVM7_PLEPL|nr:unnamed protein product [Pleuronectes platessa]
MSACTTTTTSSTITAAAAAAGRSVHYPGDPCGDGEETPLTLHCFFMPGGKSPSAARNVSAAERGAAGKTSEWEREQEEEEKEGAAN